MLVATRDQCIIHSSLRLNWKRCTAIDLLPDTQNCGLRMRRECRERFPRHRLQRKLLASDPDMHHGTCVTHVPWCMSGSLTLGGGGKRSRHSRRMRNPLFHVSGKRPIAIIKCCFLLKWVSSFHAHFDAVMLPKRGHYEYCALTLFRRVSQQESQICRMSLHNISKVGISNPIKNTWLYNQLFCNS